MQSSKYIWAYESTKFRSDGRAVVLFGHIWHETAAFAGFLLGSS